MPVLKKHSVIFSVHFAPDDFKEQKLPKGLKRGGIGVVPVPKFHSVRSPKKDTSRGLRMKQRSVSRNLLLGNVLHVA